jgi:plasmid stabilization system protein ParE
MAQVTWTEVALKHLRQITDYVAERSPERADELAERLSDAPEILEHTPKIGRRVPEFDRDDLRELVTVRPYRILYLLRDDDCYIIAIVHGRRDLTRLRPEDLEDL